MTSRPLPDELDCDVLVVGGGINGCGIARDLAGRGWNVVLCERDDLAQHTSSASTKLIHGGLRYLEHFEFGLVRKALAEREVLLRSAPHLIRPLRFVMPHDASMRPAWLIRIGLFLYDHLARRDLLPGSRAIDLGRAEVGTPLKTAYRRGFVYSDGWVDDARLVVANAIDARERGARIFTRTACVDARRGADAWTATLQGTSGRWRVRARALVNAAGPWAARFLAHVARDEGGAPLATRHLRLVKGSHIVVPRLYAHDHAYLFQSPDQRIVFAIPYEQRFTLIGTTDVEVEGNDPGIPHASEAEIAYLCEQASRYFRSAVGPADVVWTFAGVRPLVDDASGDPSSVTRDYRLEHDASGAPCLSVWGGKITTFRRLAEDAGDALGRMFDDPRPAWTQRAALAGGDFDAYVSASARTRPERAFGAFVTALRAMHPWLDQDVVHRLARAYGSLAVTLLDDVKSTGDLGSEVVPGVFERELRHLVDAEWCLTADDVLWRRSKLGLHLSADQRAAVGAWMKANA